MPCNADDGVRGIGVLRLRNGVHFVDCTAALRITNPTLAAGSWAENRLSLLPANLLGLLVLQDLINYSFAAFIHGNDFVDGRIAGEGDIDDVVTGIEHEINGRSFIEHVLVYSDLRTFGLGFDA